MDISTIWIISISFFVVVGVLGLVWPEALLKINSRTSNVVYASDSSVVDKPHFVDRKLYRSHRTVGVGLFVVSALTLYIVLFVIGDKPILVNAAGSGAALNGWVAEVGLIVATLGGVIGVCFGIILFLRPSVLKPLEAWGNRWFHAPEDALEKARGQQLESWVTRHPRWFGVMVLVSALIMWFFVFGLDHN